MIFIVLICLIVLLYPFTKKNNNKGTYCILISICLIFVSGLRSYLVGTDTHSYVNGFLSSDPISFSAIKGFLQNTEFLFYIYQSLVRTLTSNYMFLLLPIAAFYIIAVSRFIYKYSSLPVISYLIFMSMGYFLFSMAGLRQTIAMGILLFATEMLLDKKYIKCILLILLASCFHITALAYFVILVISVFSLNRVYIALVTGLSALLYSKRYEYLKVITDKIWGESRAYGKKEYGGISTLFLLIIVFFAIPIVYSQLMSKQKYFAKKTCYKQVVQPAIDSSTNQSTSFDGLFYKMLLHFSGNYKEVS